MLKVSEKKLTEFTEKYVGTVRPVLVEHPREDGSMAGFTDNYLRVILTNPSEQMANTIVPVRITEMHPEGEDNSGEAVME